MSNKRVQAPANIDGIRGYFETKYGLCPLYLDDVEDDDILKCYAKYQTMIVPAVGLVKKVVFALKSTNETTRLTIIPIYTPEQFADCVCDLGDIVDHVCDDGEIDLNEGSDAEEQ